MLQDYAHLKKMNSIPNYGVINMEKYNPIMIMVRRDGSVSKDDVQAWGVGR